jgi:DnaK suppressor protein
MRAALREKFGKELRERRRQLAATFKRNQEANRRVNDDGPLDLADTATELYTQEFNYSLSENDRAKLLMIDEALERVDAGDFGECQECGEQISEIRLKAIPWAPYCIECQEEKESGAH